MGHAFWWDRELAPSLAGKAPHLMIGNVDLATEVRQPDGSMKKKSYEETMFPTKIRNSEVARFTCFITGHFPHGAYKKRFKLLKRDADGEEIEMDKCLCGLGGHVETRDHILFSCPFYMRPIPFQRKPFVGPYRKEHHDRQLDTWYHRRQRSWRPSDIMVFLRLNPMVGTFEWAEILAKCKEDQANGNEYSKEWAVVESYTSWRSKKMAVLDAKMKEERASNKCYKGRYW